MATDAGAIHEFTDSGSSWDLTQTLYAGDGGGEWRYAFGQRVDDSHDDATS